MKKRYAYALSLATILFALTFVVNSSAARTGGGDNRATAAIGSTIADFNSTDINGKALALSTLKGKNGTALIFISAQCPVVRDYMERISKIAADYSARGVTVVGIYSNASETDNDIKAHMTANHVTFPVLRDKGNKIADQLGAEHTPEVFFLDAANKLVYHGRIDNQRNVTLVNANDLRDAIDATLAGKPVVKTEAAAFGCSIKRAS
jgi:peroxiredoxin